jgi:hypothetical protein
MDNIGGLTTDSGGNVYMSNGLGAGYGKIYKYTPAGSQSIYAGGFQTPTGIDFDDNGNLFVAEYFSRISEIPPGGGSFSVYDDTGLDHPYDLAFVPAPLPEPGSVTLLLIGVAGLLCRPKRRTARSQCTTTHGE